MATVQYSYLSTTSYLDIVPPVSALLHRRYPVGRFPEHIHPALCCQPAFRLALQEG